MGKNIDGRMDGGQIGAYRHGFRYGFPVDYNNLCPQFSGLSSKRGDVGGVNMREFHTGQNLHSALLSNLCTGLDHPWNNKVNIGIIGMIGNGNCLVSGAKAR